VLFLQSSCIILISSRQKRDELCCAAIDRFEPSNFYYLVFFLPPIRRCEFIQLGHITIHIPPTYSRSFQVSICSYSLDTCIASGKSIDSFCGDFGYSTRPLDTFIHYPGPYWLVGFVSALKTTLSLAIRLEPTVDRNLSLAPHPQHDEITLLNRNICFIITIVIASVVMVSTAHRIPRYPRNHEFPQPSQRDAGSPRYNASPPFSLLNLPTSVMESHVYSLDHDTPI
jgi:hypothetical protein